MYSSMDMYQGDTDNPSPAHQVIKDVPQTHESPRNVSKKWNSGMNTSLQWPSRWEVVDVPINPVMQLILRCLLTNCGCDKTSTGSEAT